MGEILFLAHRIPFPPDRGDKIRSHHLLKALARLAPVHVGCFGETDGDFAHEAALAVVAESHALFRRRRSLLAAGARAVARGLPVSLTAFEHPALRAWVERRLRERDVDTIFVFSGQMGQYVPAWFGGRLIVDLCDVDSAKFEAYAAERRFPRSSIDAREGRLLAAEEARLAARADCTLLISEAEAALFRSRNPDPARIEVLRNGIDTAFFDPQAARPHTEMSGGKGPHLVFTGQMDYPPNIVAAGRVIDRLLPKIRQSWPGARFHVVGRAPPASLRARDGREGVRVWGEVPDVRPFLAAADLVVAPLAIARGVQNKVLEAMAMARPVLLTPQAATGIGGEAGRHYAAGGSDGDLIARALDILKDRQRAQAMGAEARRFVVEQRGWDAMLEPLAGLVGREAAATARDAA